MKQAAGTALGAIAAALMFSTNPIAVLISLAIAAATIGFVLKMYEQSKEAKRYNTRIEDIHVLTKNPDTGETPHIERHAGNYITVEHNKVFKETDRIKQKLAESQNPLYLGVDGDGNTIPERLRIKVKPIIFRHGEHCNEFWTEYLRRAEEEISDSRRRHHKEYAEKAETFYLGANYDHGQGHLKKKRG